ncbi:MAG TPA: redoxin domain-containing protein [Longimicrobiales bacterium]|nr:redoxin domain-containing protein [Longimicrobiales bacterium]
MNWRRSALGIGISIPILGLLAYGMTLDPRDIPSPLPGREAPEFALPVLDAPDTVRLADLRGEVVVLNFWASWCMECRYEHSDLSLAATMYEPRGVRFFGVLYNDTPANGRAWIREMGGQTYPALMDAGSRTAVSYGLYGVPETFIIDQNGVVVHKQIGPITLSRLASLLEPLLEGEAEVSS